MATRQRTIRYIDIAREAGVANSVVSSYFSGNYYDNRRGAVVGIGRATRERIKEACRRLGYRPSDPSLFIEIYPEEADVFFLLNRDSGSFSYHFFSLILDGLVDEAKEKRVNLCLGWFEGGIDYCVQKDKVPLVVQNNPTGKYVFAGHPNYSLIMYLLQRGARIVYISRHVEIAGVKSIAPDYRDATRKALEYLKSCGHERIGIVADRHFHPNDYHTGQFILGCNDIFGEFSYEDILMCAYNDEEMQLIKNAFTGEESPTAVFCFDDATVMALMRNLAKLELRIPENLSIVSCNDERFSTVLSPQVTGIALPMYEIGKSAFRMVTKSAVEEPPKTAELEIWPVKLIERDSVRRI